MRFACLIGLENFVFIWNVYSLVLSIQAPSHLKFNPYIRRGYRTFLPSTKMCLQSIFWWTNETVRLPH